jgi:hypothetical protein
MYFMPDLSSVKRCEVCGSAMILVEEIETVPDEQVQDSFVCQSENCGIFVTSESFLYQNDIPQGC